MRFWHRKCEHVFDPIKPFIMAVSSRYDSVKMRCEKCGELIELKGEEE